MNTPELPESTHHHALTASTVTVGIIIVLIFAKTLGYVYSDSAAVLASLIDSLSDAGLSLMTLLSLRLSQKPADANHRQGHGKIEGVAALLQAAILMGSAVFLFLESGNRLIQPQPMHGHLYALLMLGLSAILSVVMVMVQRHSLKKHPSLALEADNAHYSTDIWINLAAIVVVALDYQKLAPVWLDAVATLLVGGLLAYSATGIAKKAVDMLMDRELAPEIREKIISIITGTPDVMGVHDLRTHQSGAKMFISFDMEVDPNILLWSAHEIARAVEHNLFATFPHAEILIHLDPAGDTMDTRHLSQKEKPQ